jgi:hypothetical protein
VGGLSRPISLRCAIGLLWIARNSADTDSPLQRSSPSSRCICMSKGSRFGCRLCTLRAPEITSRLPVGREVPRRRTARDARLCRHFLELAAHSEAACSRRPRPSSLVLSHLLQLYGLSRSLICQPSLALDFFYMIYSRLDRHQDTHPRNSALDYQPRKPPIATPPSLAEKNDHSRTVARVDLPWPYASHSILFVPGACPHVFSRKAYVTFESGFVFKGMCGRMGARLPTRRRCVAYGHTMSLFGDKRRRCKFGGLFSPSNISKAQKDGW